MANYTLADQKFMARAMRLARKGKYSAHPNPQVGAVLVLDNQIIGEGWHHQAGLPHAEINALESITQSSNGATLYVTLEPCAHEGKTGPCCKALVEANIARVVIACQDPFEEVAGKGIAMLRAAGIEVMVGLMEVEARLLNRGFFSRIERKRPFVCLKIATSMDGAIAMKNGESQWITGEHARADVQKLRAQSGAIMTGSGTVLNDNPALTVRDDSLTKNQPLRVILDSQLNISPSAKIFQNKGKTWVFCIDDQNSNKFDISGTKIIKTASTDNRVDIQAVLEILAINEINNLLIEAGPVLAGAMLMNSLIDELVIYQAPHIMGSEVQTMFHTPAWTSLMNKQELIISEVRKVGQDIKIVAKPKKRV